MQKAALPGGLFVCSTRMRDALAMEGKVALA